MRFGKPQCPLGNINSSIIRTTHCRLADRVCQNDYPEKNLKSGEKRNLYFG